MFCKEKMRDVIQCPLCLPKGQNAHKYSGGRGSGISLFPSPKYVECSYSNSKEQQTNFFLDIMVQKDSI